MKHNKIYLAIASVLATAALTGCGSSSSSNNEQKIVNDTVGNTGMLFSRATTASNCPNGGVTLKFGFDSNDNKKLDDNEVDASLTQQVCHGTNGTNGTAGTNGANGADGKDGKDGMNASGSNVFSNAGTPSQVFFNPVALPDESAKKTVLQATNGVTINGNTTQNIGYTKLFATGETDGTETFGLVKDYQDNPVKFADNSDYVCNGTNAGVGSGLDYISILQKNSKLFMVSQYECQVGAMYVNELSQDNTTGALSVKPGTLKFISQKDEFGGWVHCAGMTTPWNTHLGSEEYEPNARSVEENADATTGLTGNKYFDEIAKYWGNDIKKASPYYYGWTPEVSIDGSDNAVFAKHYSMGRFAHELAYVMPDEKTVYLSDDGTNGAIFMFVADTAKDLSAGTLYAAKWNQVSGSGLGQAVISWVSLGHTNNASVRALLDPDTNVNTNDAIRFADIFDTEAPQTDGTCATSGFKNVNTTAGNECLKLKDVNKSGAIDATDEALAARLESRRMAAYMGATTEFRKKEGITFNARDNKLYIAMSAIERGMEDNQKSGSDNTKYDIGGNNDIKLPYNKCGGIYELDVAKDSNIGSDYVAYGMKGIIAGIPANYTGTALANNSCDVNGISNPDNVTFLEGTNQLVIGEDTSKHENNFIWSYDIAKRSLTRILSTPLDAETTAPFWHKSVAEGSNTARGYMTAVTQHPMEDQTGATAAQKQSEAGYIGPFDFSQLK